MSRDDSGKRRRAAVVTDADVKRIVEAFCGSGFSRLEVTAGATRLRLSQPVQASQVEEDDAVEAILSPSVGIFHDPPETRATEGQGRLVARETLLGMIKTLNGESELRAGMRGTIAARLVEDGEFVAYGQPLFHIRRLQKTESERQGAGRDEPA